jgi:preprotein translocase subunit SecG
MIVLLTIIHVLVCIFLVIVVLLQSGKAADIAGAFGGMGSQTAFGPRGTATLLSKITTVSAALFMITSLTLSVAASRHSGGASSVLEGGRTSAPGTKKPQPVPTTPPAPAPTPLPHSGQPQPPSVSVGPETGQPSKGTPIPVTPPAQSGTQKK